MSMTNLLVAYNGLPGSDAALNGALMMQRYFGAHLTGLFAHGGSLLSQQMKPWMPANVQKAILEVQDKSHTDIEGRFRTACAAVPADKLHWIDHPGPVQRTVANYARLYDITVLGLHETAAEYGQTHIEIHPDRVALDSGRPVIVFPITPTGTLFNRRAVVAWDCGRAVARALADAMAILETEDHVEIVSVGRAPFDRTLPGIDVATVLDRHKVNVTLTELPRGRKSIAETLMAYCETSGAGLLVMGAYEHSPLREGLFGGVTHDIAQKALIPVLMSH